MDEGTMRSMAVNEPPSPSRLPHECEVCGYDLRNDALGVCPECGATLADRGRALVRRRRPIQAVFVAIACLAILVMAVLLLGLIVVILYVMDPT
jgi:predicted amidophosphoribosyltransferase